MGGNKQIDNLLVTGLECFDTILFQTLRKLLKNYVKNNENNEKMMNNYVKNNENNEKMMKNHETTMKTVRQ